MQTRELLVPVKIVIEGEMTVKSIDEGVRRAWREFPSQAWQAAVNHVERTAEKQNAGALRSKGRRKRQLWTTAGFVEFRRRRYFYAVRVSTEPASRIRELLPDRWKAEGEAATREATAAVRDPPT